MSKSRGRGAERGDFVTKRASATLRLVKKSEGGEEKVEKVGDPIVAARFRAVRKELGIARQVDLGALMGEAAKRNGGRSGAFDQTYISKLETGTIRADTLHIHTAYAAALLLTRDEWADYIDGVMPVEDVRRLRDARLRTKPGPPTLRRLRAWDALKAEAMRLDPDLRPADLEAIAETTVNGAPERVTAMRVANLARIAHEIGGDE